jgi:prophage antirepressor-like protein
MNLQTFTFEATPVRVLGTTEAPLFVASDVCRVLEIVNPRDALGSLDEDEKGVGNTDTLGGKQGVNVVTESGLYALIFKSRKAAARRFRKWVTAEVLPALRRSGAYRLSHMGDTKLAVLRLTMFEVMQGVINGTVDKGRASGVALLAGRYLESIKLEAEIYGYETVRRLRSEAAPEPVLLEQDGSMSRVPVQEVP